MNLKKVGIKNHTWFYFDDIFKAEDFDFDISLDEKSCKRILLYNTSYFLSCSIKQIGLSEIMMELNTQYHLVLRNIMLFMIELDILEN